MDQKERQELLDEARETQTAFWVAMSALEVELGFEVDSNQDLTTVTIESLIEAGGTEV